MLCHMPLLPEPAAPSGSCLSNAPVGNSTLIFKHLAVAQRSPPHPSLCGTMGPTQETSHQKGGETHSVTRIIPEQPAPSSFLRGAEGAQKLLQPSQAAEAVQCFPALLFPSRHSCSPRCSALMGSGCPDPT